MNFKIMKMVYIDFGVEFEYENIAYITTWFILKYVKAVLKKKVVLSKKKFKSGVWLVSTSITAKIALKIVLYFKI